MENAGDADKEGLETEAEDKAPTAVRTEVLVRTGWEMKHCKEQELGKNNGDNVEG